MLIDPSACDPRDHIRFKLEKAVARTEAGQITIDALGLNRDPLLESRHERLHSLVTLWDNVEMARALGLEDRVTDGLRTLDHAVLPHSPYSSMAIDLIDGLRAAADATE